MCAVGGYGTWFSLLASFDEKLEKWLLLSSVTDMEQPMALPSYIISVKLNHIIVKYPEISVQKFSVIVKMPCEPFFEFRVSINPL